MEVEKENEERKIFIEIKDNIETLIHATNNIVLSEGDDVLQQHLNETNSIFNEVQKSLKGRDTIHRLVYRIEERKNRESRENGVLHKIKGVAGEIRDGIKTAAKEIIEEADMAITSGPLSATSFSILIKAEKAALQKNLEFGATFDVHIGDGKTIRTILFQASRYHEEVRVPLVMLHGMGGGLPTYHKNFQNLHEDREVYAIDLPGFSLSSRVAFIGGAKECTNMFVDIIDKWRQMVRLDQIILAGHSFGGYIASAYAVKYPERVKHLVLLDPWGIRPKDEDEASRDQKLWQHGAIELSHLVKSNPFSMLRRTGPLAPLIGDIFISERIKLAYGDNVTSYFVHSLIQDSLPTGERAFSTISGFEYLWAKFPMKSHLVILDESIPITFIHGVESPFPNTIGKEIGKKRKNVFTPDPILGAGHHVHAEKPEEVNKIIKNVFSLTDASSR